MSERTPDNQNTPPNSTQSDVVDSSRRKLAGAALGISAIFTLASRPVLAGQCMTPSSAASGNLSTHGTPDPCTGQTPAEWVASASDSINVNFHLQTTDPILNGVFKKGSRATGTATHCSKSWPRQTTGTRAPVPIPSPRNSLLHYSISAGGSSTPVC